MAKINGSPAGPDGVGGAYLNTVESDRAALWDAIGGRQGVIRGLTHAGIFGQMSLMMSSGSAMLAERDNAGGLLNRGYHVWTDADTVVQFQPASAQNRVDAVVAAFVDTEDGPVGTGGLDVGAHLVAVPGVSGVTTPRSDAAITAWLGRGGWVRLLDVPVASTDTQINVANISKANSSILDETGWQPVSTSSAFQPVAGSELQIKRTGNRVVMHGSVTRQVAALTAGAAASGISSVNLAAEFRPVRTVRDTVVAWDTTGALVLLSVLTDGSMTVRNQGTANVPVGGRLDFISSWLTS